MADGMGIMEKTPKINRLEDQTILFSDNNTPASKPHPRQLGWFGTACIAMGGSNQSLFLISALLIGQGDIPGQGSMAIPLLIIGVLISWAAMPGWIELTLMFPNRVGGIAATCTEAFRPYSEVLSNLTGVCYWWGWIPTCGISALISASAIQQWYLPWAHVSELATLIVLIFTWVNLRGIHFTSLVAIPIATVSSLLALISGLVPIFTGHVNWQQASTFHLTVPFSGGFGAITSLMAGLYLIGFAAPAFEQAACHVGEQRHPEKDQPRSLYAAGAMAGVYFILLPVVWLGVLGPEKLSQDLTQVLGPTFAPLFGATAKAAAIWFVAFNLFHDTIAPLAGSTRTLLQLADDGLLPRAFSLRAPSDAPSFATVFTAIVAIIFLWIGDPLWLIAAANFTYLIGICMPNIAVWLLRKDQPDMPRPWRAPRGTIMLGVIAALIWTITTILGFEQFGLPTVIAGVAFAYAGAILYACRKMSDRKRRGLPLLAPSLHVKLTGAMLLVLTLDAVGYLIAVNNVPTQHAALITLLADIFVVVAMLTISVGLVLPGMVASSARQVANAAKRLNHVTVADFSRAMVALGKGDLETAYARIEINPVIVHSHDEISEMAKSFNELQLEIMRAATGLDAARIGLQNARNELVEKNKILLHKEQDLRRMNETLEQRVKERTAELEAAQQQLISSARQVGMAEVANNVLHNIGNVLNSVNVSASLINEKISESPLSNLTQVSFLLTEHKDNLAKFLTEDKRGMYLPDYLIALADYWKNEKGFILKELTTLSENVDHIKSIVTTQQSLSGNSSFTQEVDIALLIEDALKITGMDIHNKFGITFRKEYSNLDPVITDKAKLMQILVNLIRNSKDALLESSNPEKILTLKISLNSHNNFIIEVADNGVGISPENLKNIFHHGFTTKKHGHGFGLHSCALAAKEMHGSLHVHSDGPGKGATFRLELPFRTSRKGQDHE